ncbi:MAG: hypothetical protein D6788_11995 [Planctomycetota bacterium]|nr:MAG: hypothetical protein D6788_11995 [Planctomycetota bacterium]
MRTCGVAAWMILLTAGAGLAAPGRGETTRTGDPDAHLAKATVSVPLDDAATGEGILAGTAANLSCLSIGSFDSPFAGTDLFRGNVYRIEQDNTVLRQIKMQLQFVGTVTLRFSIHRMRSNDPTGVFERVMPDLVVTETGDGIVRLYPTQDILLDLPLETGFDYLIGVQWTQTDGFNRSVGFGRDTLVYPRPFLHGQVLGLAAINTSVPLEDQLTNVAVPGDFGVYSFELCFTPVPGACCKPSLADSGGCVETLPADCNEPGGFFHGERTSCFSGRCRFGACCDPCGGCLPDHAPEACEAIQGTWAGANIACGPAGLCEPVVGACCQPNGTCSEVCEADCLAGGGTYHGDGTSCFPNPCVGACCITDVGCVDLPESTCLSLGGFRAYRGDGTTCADLPPDLECGGACCATLATTGDPLCFIATTRAECTDSAVLMNTTYLGDASRCPPNAALSCPSAQDNNGACCLPDGGCQVGTADFCQTSGGSFHAGLACDEITCGTVCCPTGGGCMLIDPAAGDSCAGTIIPPGTNPATTCVPNECDGLRLGSCCLAGQSCTDSVTPRTCERSGGRFIEGGTDCAADCPADLGACCRPTGVCTDNVTAAECTEFGGVHSPNLRCSELPAACPQPGACCTDTGACVVVLESECATLGHFRGEGTACGSDTCPTGACCLPDLPNSPGCGQNDGFCQHLTFDACADLGGDYHGDGSRCDNLDVCCGQTPRACCLAADTCDVLTPQECFDAGGLLDPDNATCGTETCALGACCSPDLQNGGIGCTDGLFPLECVQKNGTHFPGRLCVGDPCAGLGACCTGATCELLTQADCEAQGGTFQGVDSTCLTVACEVLTISATVPASMNCSTDGREPSAPDGTPEGIDSISLDFTGDPSPLQASDFVVTVVPGGTGVTVPSVIAVAPSGTRATLTLSSPIPAGQWTCINVIGQPERACIGSLPGDVDDNGTTEAADVPILVDCVTNGTCALLRCDTDRSGACGAADILRLIDLLNGGGNYDVWLDTQIGGTCPSTLAP